MTFEEVLRILQDQGGRLGTTCNGAFAGRAGALTFTRCCGSDRPDAGFEEYIARGKLGGIVHLSLNRDTGLITCGPKVYRHRRGHRATCLSADPESLK